MADLFGWLPPTPTRSLPDRCFTTSLNSSTPRVTPQVGELLAAIQGEMKREALQAALGLSDRKSFRERYLKPALTGKGRQWLRPAILRKLQTVPD